nr:uncharacterized protein LOC113811951 [Penaeus vannamei]
MDSEVTHRARAGCMNWRKMSGVLCDKKISARVKGKLYETTVRPAMIYGAETWPTKRSQERKFEVEDMNMLRWMCGVTRLNKIRSEMIRGTVKVEKIPKKAQERRLQWCGHAMRGEDYVGRRIYSIGYTSATYLCQTEPKGTGRTKSKLEHISRNQAMKSRYL